MLVLDTRAIRLLSDLAAWVAGSRGGRRTGPLRSSGGPTRRRRRRRHVTWVPRLRVIASASHRARHGEQENPSETPNPESFHGANATTRAGFAQAGGEKAI